MSLFKKRKGLNTIRQRRFGEDFDDEEKNEDSGLNLENISALKKDKKKSKVKDKLDKKSTAAKAVLSFDDELEADDGIIFQEKKSSLSYKLKKEMKKERKEKKKEEKERLRGPEDRNKESNGKSYVSELAEMGIRIVNGREAEAIAHVPGDSDEDDPLDMEEEGKHKFRMKNKTPTKSLDPWKKVLESGAIPDANMIHMIRKKRQQAREQGDVIPIDDTVRVEQQKGRLIREDDNDRSDDESTRLDFNAIQDVTDRKLRKEVFEAAQDEDREGSDNENEWEKQQLLKSGANSKLMESDSLSQDGFGNGMQMTNHGAASYYPMGTEEPSWGTAADTLIPGCSTALSRPSNYQAEGIIKRLRDSRESFNEVHRRHRAELDTIIDDLVACKMTIVGCNDKMDPLTERFQFYQDMRGYVTDLRECLDEKVMHIRRLEQQTYLLFRQRSQKIIQRRRQDVKDQNNEFSPFAAKNANNDEYRMRRAAEREGRRTRRRREREKKGDAKHHNGTSTDDEEPQSEQQMMSAEFDKIGRESEEIFEDVYEDFSKLNKIIGKFEAWREIDYPTYSDAYVSFNLPKLFAPYIRLQLLLWNPLSRDGNSLEVEKMKWYNQLIMYGVNKESLSSEKFKLDPDRKLMSHLIEKLVLGKLKELVDCCWDPLSHFQTVRLVNLVRHYTQTYPSLSPVSKPLKELMQSVMTKIRDSIDNDVFIPMFPKNVYESKTSGVSMFFQRQFWVAWKLLSSVLMWHNVLNDNVIHDLAIRSLLNLYLLPALNLAADINMSDALDKCRNVINALPREWSKQDSKSKDGHVFLARFQAVLVSFATKLDPAKNKSEIKEITELLSFIGAKNQSQLISDKYL